MRKTWNRVLCMILAVVTVLCSFSITDVQAASTTKVLKPGDSEIVDGVKLVADSEVYSCGNLTDGFYDAYDLEICNTATSITDVTVEYFSSRENKEKKREIRLLPNKSETIIIENSGLEVKCTVNILYTASVQRSKTKTIKKGKSAMVNGLLVEVDTDGEGRVNCFNTTDQTLMVTAEFFTYKNGKKVRACETASDIVEPGKFAYETMYGTEVKCTVSCLATVNFRFKKHGKKNGVEYKVSSKTSQINRIFTVFENKNSYPVCVTGTISLLNKKGKDIKRLKEYNTEDYLPGPNGEKVVDTVGSPRYRIYNDNITLYLYPHERFVVDTHATSAFGYNANVVTNCKVSYKVKKVNKVYGIDGSASTHHVDQELAYQTYHVGETADLGKKCYILSKKRAVYMDSYSMSARGISIDLHFCKDVSYGVVMGAALGYGAAVAYYDEDGYFIGYRQTKWGRTDISKGSVKQVFVELPNVDGVTISTNEIGSFDIIPIDGINEWYHIGNTYQL